MVISTERTSSEFLRLNSCARQCVCQKDFHTLRENGRSDWHILYITNGCCLIDEGGISRKVEKGNIILYKPFERQSYKFFGNSRTVSCYIHFCGRGCGELLRSAKITERVTYVGLSGVLDNLFTRMCEEYTVKKAMHEEVCSAILYEFIIQAGRLKHYRENKTEIKNTNSMNEICEKMYNELSENKSVSDYAALCNLSVDRFSHSLKESIGISPKQYIMKMRVGVACELLANTGLDISSVAENVGITDISYFCRMIKKHTGKTPLYFRK